MLGSLQVHVRYKSKDFVLPLLVTEGNGCSLLGRNWFSEFKIRVSGIHQVSGNTDVQKILAAHGEAFEPKIIGYGEPQINLELKDNAAPSVSRACQVPFAFRSVGEVEL